MDNIFLIAAFISFIFFVAKFFEMKYIDQEPKPLKLLIRDTLLVYISVILGNFITQQLSPVIHEIEAPTTPQAFTDNPPF